MNREPCWFCRVSADLFNQHVSAGPPLFAYRPFEDLPELTSDNIPSITCSICKMRRPAASIIDLHLVAGKITELEAFDLLLGEVLFVRRRELRAAFHLGGEAHDGSPKRWLDMFNQEMAEATFGMGNLRVRRLPCGGVTSLPDWFLADHCLTAKREHRS